MFVKFIKKNAKSKRPIVSFVDFVGFKIESSTATSDDRKVIAFAIRRTRALENSSRKTGKDIGDFGKFNRLGFGFLTGILRDDFVEFFADEDIADDGNAFATMAHEDTAFTEHAHEGFLLRIRNDRKLVENGIAFHFNERNNRTEVFEFGLNVIDQVEVEIKFVERNERQDGGGHGFQTIVGEAQGNEGF